MRRLYALVLLGLLSIGLCGFDLNRSRDPGAARKDGSNIEASGFSTALSLGTMASETATNYAGKSGANVASTAFWQALTSTACYVQAFNNVNQTVAAGGADPLAMSGEAYDLGANWSVSTFTAPIKGIYSVDVNLVAGASSGGAGYLSLIPFVNGAAGTAPYLYSNALLSTSVDITHGMSFTMRLDAGNTLSINVSNAGASNVLLYAPYASIQITLERPLP